MKKISVIILSAVVLFAFSSCKKCLDCQYVYTDGDYEYTYTYDQYCGTKKNREDFEAMVKTESDDHSGDYTCAEAE